MITLCLDGCCPVSILFRAMLSAIRFDYELFAVAREVGDIGTEWHLTPEARLRKGGADERPQRLFRIGRCLAVGARTDGAAGRWNPLHGAVSSGEVTPTQPSPIKGEGF